MEENIRVLFKPVGQPWEGRTIRNCEDSLQDLVEGPYGYIKITDRLALVINVCISTCRDLNFVWGQHCICGPAVMVGICGPKTISCRLDAEDLDLARCYSVNVYEVEDLSGPWIPIITGGIDNG